MQAEFPATLPRVLARAARLFGDAPAIVEDQRRLTFRELESQVLQASAAFLATGLAPGDRVALWAPNCAEWIVAALGAQGCGGVIVPLNTRLKGSEAAGILRRSRPLLAPPAPLVPVALDLDVQLVGAQVDRMHDVG